MQLANRSRENSLFYAIVLSGLIWSSSASSSISPSVLLFHLCLCHHTFHRPRLRLQFQIEHSRPHEWMRVEALRRLVRMPTSGLPSSGAMLQLQHPRSQIGLFCKGRRQQYFLERLGCIDLQYNPSSLTDRCCGLLASAAESTESAGRNCRG
jgi:hypothetical protein